MYIKDQCSQISLPPFSRSAVAIALICLGCFSALAQNAGLSRTSIEAYFEDHFGIITYPGATPRPNKNGLGPVMRRTARPFPKISTEGRSLIAIEGAFRSKLFDAKRYISGTLTVAIGSPNQETARLERCKFETHAFSVQGNLEEQADVLHFNLRDIDTNYFASGTWRPLYDTENQLDTAAVQDNNLTEIASFYPIEAYCGAYRISGHYMVPALREIGKPAQGSTKLREIELKGPQNGTTVFFNQPTYASFRFSQTVWPVAVFFVVSEIDPDQQDASHNFLTEGGAVLTEAFREKLLQNVD